jgi:hypothetical protein
MYNHRRINRSMDHNSPIVIYSRTSSFSQRHYGGRQLVKRVLRVGTRAEKFIDRICPKTRQASTSKRRYSLTSPKLKIQEPKSFTLGSSGKHPNGKLFQLIDEYRHICRRRHEIDDRVLVHSQHSSNQRVEIPPAPRIVHRLASHTVLSPVLALEIVINE